jgi:hypothetical protein
VTAAVSIEPAESEVVSVDALVTFAPFVGPASLSPVPPQPAPSAAPDRTIALKQREIVKATSTKVSVTLSVVCRA